MKLPVRLFVATSALLLLEESQSFTPGHSTKRSFSSSRQMLDDAAYDIETVQSVGFQVQNLIIPGVAAAVAGAAALFIPKGEKKEATKAVSAPEPEPIDVSIPYDATAMLAYENWRKENEKGAFNAATFESFSKIYYDMSVETVTAKKLKREAEAMMAAADAGFSKAEKLAASLIEL
mmetsp:Transcript_40531/g.61452  ORF Transcript_40531/g.61452 Transcript_40531/m.61452 type:complete len:177 (-) Transcript_40531:435-965(-)